MIQIHRLEGFFWVAKTGGYARAARAFPYPITQPAVHQQVKKLESQLGVQLFERVGKEVMKLTPAGRHLHAFAAPFFEQLPAVVRSLKASDLGGDFHIHASGLFLRALLPVWVKRLQRKLPKVQVHLHEYTTADVEVLRRGETDLLVQYLPKVPIDVATQHIATLSGFLVVPKGHRLDGRKRASLRELGADTFVSYSPGLLAHDLQMKALKDHGVEPNRIISTSTLDTIVAFVEAGIGVSAVASMEPGGPRGKGFVSIPVTQPKFEVPVYAAWRKSTPKNPILAAVRETAPKP